MSTWIELRGLTKSFKTLGKTRQVLRDFDLTINRCEWLHLVGANGAGKSTLLRLLAGVLLPNAGELWLDGAKISSNELPSTAVLFEGERHFYGRLSVTKNLNYFAALQAIRPLPGALKEAAAIWEVDTLLERPFEKLSAGQRQRVGLCRVDLSSAKLLLLDDPFHALDDSGVALLLKKIVAWRQAGKSIVTTASRLQPQLHQQARLVELVAP